MPQKLFTMKTCQPCRSRPILIFIFAFIMVFVLDILLGESLYSCPVSSLEAGVCVQSGVSYCSAPAGMSCDEQCNTDSQGCDSGASCINCHPSR